MNIINWIIVFCMIITFLSGVITGLGLPTIIEAIQKKTNKDKGK